MQSDLCARILQRRQFSHSFADEGDVSVCSSYIPVEDVYTQALFCDNTAGLEANYGPVCSLHKCDVKM